MSTKNLTETTNIFGQNLRNARKASRLTLRELGEKLNISYAYIAMIETGKREPDQLVKNTIEKWLKGHNLPETVTIPVLGAVPAGFPQYVAEEVTEWVTRNDVPAGSYALRIKGDSMPPLVEGDYVAFIQDGDYRNGDRVVVHNEWGEFMVKRLRISQNESKVLTSDNPNYPDIEPNEHYRIIGKVVKGWRDII